MAENKESFEKSLERLEEVVDQMESGELNLEEMIKRFEEGTKLVDQCSSKLNQVEQKIEKLIKSKNGLSEEPFENNE